MVRSMLSQLVKLIKAWSLEFYFLFFKKNLSLEFRVGKYEFCYFCTVECCIDSGNFLLFYSSFIKMTLCIWSLIKPLVGSPYSWFKDYWTVVASTCMWDWFLFLEKSVDDLTSNNKEPYLREIKAPTYMTSISTTT